MTGRSWLTRGRFGSKAPTRVGRRARRCAGIAVCLVFAIAMPAWGRGDAPRASIEIRRTTDGIPHIRAGSWRGLGIGYGQVQAEDALCTLAEAFVTYAGDRSAYFGADEHPQTRATFGTPRNLDLDFFFKAFAGADAVQALKQAQPADLDELVGGYAEGYNHQVRKLRQQSRSAREPACARAPWVRAIEPDDVWRRMIAAGLAERHCAALGTPDNAFCYANVLRACLGSGLSNVFMSKKTDENRPSWASRTRRW